MDGGNVIKARNWTILTDKVFIENPSLSEKQIIAQLEKLFDARIIIIPREPCDFTEHADGMLRYYDEETVLINNYGTSQSVTYQKRLRKSLAGLGFKLIEVPYEPNQVDSVSADGIYINFLQMENFVLVPTFQKKKMKGQLRYSKNYFQQLQFEQLTR